MPGKQPKPCLYFGTFNPVHTGHLMIAQAVLNQFELSDGIERIVFIPAGLSPHRKQEEDLADAMHRLNMVALATANNPAFLVSDYEIQKTTTSYTVETVEALIEQGLVKAPVPMIIGSDALVNLDGWHRASDLVKLACFLQMPRPGTPLVEQIQMDGKTVALNTRAIDMPMLSLSSSWVREQIRLSVGDCREIRAFVPEAARCYIRDNALYRGEGSR